MTSIAIFTLLCAPFSQTAIADEASDTVEEFAASFDEVSYIYADQQGNTFSGRSGVQPYGIKVVNICGADNENMHYSRNSGGVIFKVRVQCMKLNGGYDQVDFHLQGAIFKNNRLAASSAETKSLLTNKKQYTFYVPRTGSNAGSGNATWKGTWRGAIVGGTPVGRTWIQTTV